MAAQLVERLGQRELLRRELGADDTGIGRDSVNSACIEGPLISRFHAKICESSSGFSIVDLSKNGTWLNGRRLERDSPELLRSGDRVTLPGVEVELVFLEEAAQGVTVTSDGWGETDSGSGALRINPVTMHVWRDGVEIDLTPREQECFELLYKNRRTVVTRTQIMEHVWGYEVGKNDLDELIYLLRRKLDKDSGDRLPYLVTLRGKGYRLNL